MSSDESEKLEKKKVVKRIMSEKQKEAFQRAAAKRLENIAIKKELKKQTDMCKKVSSLEAQRIELQEELKKVATIEEANKPKVESKPAPVQSDSESEEQSIVVVRPKKYKKKKRVVVVQESESDEEEVIQKPKKKDVLPQPVYERPKFNLRFV